MLGLTIDLFLRTSAVGRCRLSPGMGMHTVSFFLLKKL